jgi:hypothetical protein
MRSVGSAPRKHDSADMAEAVKGGPPTADMDGSVRRPSVQAAEPRSNVAESGAAREISKVAGNFRVRWPTRPVMDVPTSPRPNAANPPATSSAMATQGSSVGGRAQAATAAPSVPFASLLARAPARGKLGAAMFGRARGACAGARGGGLRAGSAAAGEPGGGRIESLLHRKKQDEGDGRDAVDDGGGADGADGGDDGGTKYGPRRGDAADVDWLDPSARHAAQLAPPGLLAGSAQALHASNATEPVRARSLEELIPALVRRIAWAGDRNKGTVRLELGAGMYAGTTVTVHADGGRVRVEIGGSEGPELDRLRARLDTRLRGHGLDVESVT